MKKYFSAFFLFSLSLVLLPLTALASPNDDLTARERLSTARGVGLANALVANASGTSAVWHNPAAITSAVMYSLETAYRFNNATNSHGVQANILDMKSNPYVGAEIGYNYEYSKIEGKSQHFHHVRLGLAVPLADNIVSLGVTGAYSNIKYNGDNTLSQFTMDVGLMIRPTNWLSLAFTTQNIIVGDYELVMPRIYAAGIAFNSLELGLGFMFEASFNGSADDIAKTGSYGVGFEYLLLGSFPIRLGYRYEMPDDQHVFAAGVGYRDKAGMVGVDISYQHHFEPSENDILNAGLSLYF